MQRKKIALLNMMYDNNYGGNLQRYAMVWILQRMGYSVEYLYIRSAWREDWMQNGNVFKRVFRFFKQLILHIIHPSKEPWFAWNREGDYYRNVCAITEPFLEKYIHHTVPVKSHEQLVSIVKNGRYDAIVAGSDQIWRIKYVRRYGIGTWFMDFVPNAFAGKLIVYGASFGVDEKEYTEHEVRVISPLFERLTAVSVREKSGLRLLQEYGWTNPSSQEVLDPTLLLLHEDYEQLINATDTIPGEGDMFCYILDESEETKLKIKEIADKRGLKPFIRTIYGENRCSVEQWLRYIRDAKFVYTDSYHGFLFSLLFHKPYYISINKKRGASRFETMMENLEISLDTEPNWEKLDEKLNILRDKSLLFLKQALDK